MVEIIEVMPFGVHPTSGVRAAVLDLSRQLAGAGARVVLAGPVGRDSPGVPGVDVVSLLGMSKLSTARAIAGLAAEMPAAVVHLHNGFSPMNNFVGEFAGKPYVVTTHGVYASAVMARGRVKKAFAVALLERRLLTRARTVTALTAIESAEIDAVAPAARVEVLPLGFDPPDKTTGRRSLRDELGVAPDCPLAVYVGRLDVVHKRLPVMIDALRGASGWHVAMVGGDEASGRRVLENAAREAGVEHRLHIAPPRFGPDLEPALSDGDVAVLLSKSEGLPRALLECMLRGVPAIVSAEVDERVGVVGAGGGWRADDAAGLVTALDRVGADRAAKRRAGQAARRHAQRFLWSRVLGDWIDLFTCAADR